MSMIRASFEQIQQIHPKDILFVILALIGPDIIQSALAQLSGPLFTPVAFSFGWVAYSFKNLALAYRLMPKPDFASIVIDGETGYTCDNHNWVLGRILRDFNHWKPVAIENQLREVLQEATSCQDTEQERDLPLPQCKQAGLCVSVFHASPKHKAGVPVADWVYYSGIFVAVIQLGISVIPWAIHQEWAIFVVTASGILLAFATGALPQWKIEKWGHNHADKTVILTHGNGAQHALVIIGNKDFLDLESLSVAVHKVSLLTRFCICLLAVLWIVHLITVTGIKEDLWFLMAIGWIGMLHSIMVTRVPRKPEALGLPLEFETCIAQPGVMATLKEVEKIYPKVGASMVHTFFPGKLPEEEEIWWNSRAEDEY